MERLKIITSVGLFRVPTDDIAYIEASGNYCDVHLFNGESVTMTFQLHYFVEAFSRFDDMCEHMKERDGSYFRQFVLVSNGELPQRFFLHGKVERKALARTADDRLCIIATRHPETLWDFANALREYGYVDAVYLTGGNESGFYRAPDGTAYFTEKAAKYRTDKHHGVAPWLVLRKR